MLHSTALKVLVIITYIITINKNAAKPTNQVGTFERRTSLAQNLLEADISAVLGFWLHVKHE